MNLKQFSLVVLAVFYAAVSLAQDNAGNVQSRVLILLDESSSMIQPWAGGKKKYKAAYDVIMRLMDSAYAINNDIEFSLRAFGEQNTVDEKNCYDTKNEVPFSKNNQVQMSLRLEAMHPLGITPIAYTLGEAVERDLIEVSKYAYSIILITDGGESCGGDICDVYRRLMKGKTMFRPYVICLENDPALPKEYSCMADYLQALSDGEITRAVSTVMTAFRPALKISVQDYKKSFSPIKAVAMSALAARQVALVAAAINDMLQGHPLSPTILPALPPLVIEKAPAETMEAMTTKPAKPFSETANVTGPANGHFSDLPALPPIVVEKAAAEEMDGMSARSLKPFAETINVTGLAAGSVLTQRTLPALPALVADSTPAIIVVPIPKPTPKPAIPDPKEATLEVIFTNGKGKFYVSKPEVVLSEAGTGKEVKRFIRKIDGLGNIDVQKNIPTGSYDLTFPRKKDLVMRNVKLDQKANRVMVTVRKSIISFRYGDNPSRPVKEFKAVITPKLITQGFAQDQKCTDSVAYEPGAYIVEINTFPRAYIPLDLDFNEDTVISIFQPGIGKFAGPDIKTHTVSLQQNVNGKLVQFYVLNLSDPESEHLRIEPGKYEAHYYKGHQKALGNEFITPFTITALEETLVELK